MSALGQKQIFAAQEDISVLSPIAIAKANSCKKVMSASPLKRTDALQNEMSAKGQQRTCSSEKQKDRLAAVSQEFDPTF